MLHASDNCCMVLVLLVLPVFDKDCYCNDVIMSWFSVVSFLSKVKLFDVSQTEESFSHCVALWPTYLQTYVFYYNVS